MCVMTQMRIILLMHPLSSLLGKPIGASNILVMCINFNILNRCSEIREFIKRSSRSKRPSSTEIEKRVNKEFVDWFQKRVSGQPVVMFLFAMFTFKYD